MSEWCCCYCCCHNSLIYCLCCLLADDLDKDVLPSSAVELAIEDLLPGAKVKLAIGDSNNALTAKELTLDVGVAVVLACAVVEVLGSRGVRDPLLKEGLEVLVTPALCNSPTQTSLSMLNVSCVRFVCFMLYF